MKNRNGDFTGFGVGILLRLSRSAETTCQL